MTEVRKNLDDDSKEPLRIDDDRPKLKQEATLDDTPILEDEPARETLHSSREGQFEDPKISKQ